MDVLIAVLLAPLTAITAYFAVEVLAGLRRQVDAAQTRSAATAVLVVPANNEERVIAGTLEVLTEAARGVATILVVADNCSDATAAAARAAGCTVIERTDADRRGKGFALAFAREHLSQSPPDVVVVADADCRLDAHSLKELVAVAGSTGRPAQAVNLLRPSSLSTPLVRLSNFAFMLKNLVRQRGLQRLAGRAHLTGTGMALPWPLFARANLATANIVEDLQLGLDFASQGFPARLASSAYVWSGAADSRETLVQRSRWEGGFLSTARSLVPRLLGEAASRRSLKGLAAALDLCVPPLALLVLINVAALLIAGLATWMADAAAWPIVLHSSVLALAMTAVFLAWLREGRRFIGLRDLALAPLYVAWKLPLYLKLARGAPTDWLRTKR